MTENLSLKAAEAVLEEFGKVEAAIQGQNARMADVIGSLEQAGSDLQMALTEDAVEGGNGVLTKAAKKRLAEARAEVDLLGEMFSGLRSRAVAVAAEMPEVLANLSPDLPSLNAEVEAGFADEWAAAVEAFSIVLGKRAAIEAVLGRPMNLAEPAPAPTTLDPEVARPKRAVDALQKTLATVESRFSPSTDDLPQPGPYQVFIMRRAVHGFEIGTKVLPSAFPEGKLATLVSANWAVPARDKELKRNLFGIRRAILGMDEDKRRESAERSAAEGRKRAEERRAFLKRMGYEEEETPSRVGNGGNQPTFIENLLNGPSPDWPGDK